MRKLRKILRTLIVFLIIENAVYATNDIISKDIFDIKKTITLGAGIFLVVQILYISYKKDKEVEQNFKSKNKKLKKNILETSEIIGTRKDDKKEEKIVLQEESDKLKKEEQNLFSTIKVEKEIETIPSDKVKKENLTRKKEKIKKEENAPTVAERKTAIKIEGEIKKKTTKKNGENKKEETKVAVETKKRATKKVADMAKKYSEDSKEITNKKSKTEKKAPKSSSKTKRKTDKK